LHWQLIHQYKEALKQAASQVKLEGVGVLYQREALTQEKAEKLVPWIFVDKVLMSWDTQVVAESFAAGVSFALKEHFFLCSD
jgi:hypothetical protein